ncbi:MAG: NADH-quinone oxidoreductase subunit N, partial [Bacteroidetes bacterium]|nr:NADH-quinone oxidoreductase subunit N [Bacteroidota bacterium]
MNALILSAVWGVVMMFSGILLKQRSAIRNFALVGLVLVLSANILEMSGTVFFHIDTKGMLVFDRFSLLAGTIIFASTLLYLIVSSKEIERVGIHYADYLALIFFILCGISLVVSFKSLLL